MVLSQDGVYNPVDHLQPLSETMKGGTTYVARQAYEYKYLKELQEFKTMRHLSSFQIITLHNILITSP